MYVYHRKIFAVFLTVLFFLLSVSPLTIVTTNTTIGGLQFSSSEKSVPLSNFSMQSTPYPVQTPTTYIENSNFTSDMVLRYDSIVEIKDSEINGSTDYPSYYLYNNSVLILDNITFLDEISAHLYDFSTLIIKNANDNGFDNDIYAHDNSTVYIINSEFMESDIKLYDNSSAAVYNSTLDYPRITDNSECFFENVTISGYVRLYDNATLTVKNSDVTRNIYAYDANTIYMENTTLQQDLWLYEASVATIRNSTCDDIWIYSGSAYVTVVNSTLDQIRSYSGSISDIYNSTLNSVSHGFIIDGKGVYDNGILEMLSGTLYYNIRNDSDTHFSSEGNVTYFYVKPNGNLTITETTSLIRYVYLDNATVFINDTAIIETLETYDSTVKMNKTNITYSAFYNNTYINANNSSFTSYMKLYDSSAFKGSNLEFGSIIVSSATLSMMFFKNIGGTYVLGDAVLNATYGYLNETQITLINSTFIANEVNFTGATIDADPSTLTISDSLLDNANLTSSDSTLTLTNCTGAKTRIDVNSSQVTVDNSTLYMISPYEGSSVIVQNNSTINSIYADEEHPTSVVITDSSVAYLSVKSMYAAVSATKSNIVTLLYSINVTSGNVNISDNEIVSSPGSTFVSTFTKDDATNITTYFLSYLYVDSANMCISNQTISQLLSAINSDVMLSNVTGDVYFSGSSLSINNSSLNVLLIEKTSKSSLHINGSKISIMYTGLAYNFTTYTFSPLEEGVYGNATFTDFGYIYAYTGVMGISNSSIGQIVSGTFSKVYLYNSTVTSTFYQVFYFTNDGLVNGTSATGFADVGIVNVTGNTISGTIDIGFVIVFGGTVTLNNTSCALIGFNNSEIIALNSTIYGFDLHNSSVGYFNISFVDFWSGIGNNSLTENAKLYLNSTEVNLIKLFDQSSLDGYNTTFVGVGMSSNIATIEQYDSSSVTLRDSSLGFYGVVLYIADNAKFMADNVSATGTTSTTIISAMGNAQISWNNSELELDPVMMYYTPIQLADHSNVYFNNVSLNITAPSYQRAYIVTYNWSVFTAVNFYYPNTTNVVTGILAHDFSEVFVYNTTTFILTGFENSTTTAQNSWLISGVELYDNATCFVFNDKYNPNRMYGVFSYDESVLTLQNVSLEIIEAWGTLHLEDVANTTGLYITLYNLGKIFADNLTANMLILRYEEPEPPFDSFTLSNSKVDKLILPMTIVSAVYANFTGINFTSTPSGALFRHLTLNNVNTTKIELCLNVKGNTQLNGTDANIAFLYVGYIAESVAPVISVTPDSMAFESGLSSQLIIFTISEPHPYMYVVTRNSTIIKSGFYSDGENIIVNASSFSIGHWIVTLTANDTSRNTASASATVTVYPNETPVFTSKPPRTYTMTVGSTGNVLNWTATDASPTFYEIYVNGTLEVNASWISGTPITYNIDSFQGGSYNVTLFFTIKWAI